jgi:calcineurin-like phosphoesterase family protein
LIKIRRDIIGNVYFCSDLHISHKNIGNFRKEVGSEEGNRAYIKHWWDKLVTKRDIVWVLGDSAFTEEGIDWIAALAGEKRLVRGNHCDLPTTSYLRAFSEIYGLYKYKGMWLSHAPIHPDELRGKVNCSGHIHYANIKKQIVLPDGSIGSSTEDDPRYLNCCVENFSRHLGRPLATLDEVRNYFKTGELTPIGHT